MGKYKNKEKFNKKIAPLMLLMVVPLVMFSQYIVYDNILTSPDLIIKDSYVDLFNFYKSIALYIISVLSIIFYFLYTKKRDIELKKDRIKYYIPLLIYTIFIVLSTVFSIYPKIAVFGVYERYEGALVLLSYLLMMVYAIEVIRSETDIKYIMKAFIVMNFIISSIGVLQTLGANIFEVKIFQSLLGLTEADNLLTHFGNSAYSTLYNPNNAGQFTTLVFPVLLILVFALKDIKWRIFTALTAILTFIMVFGSASDNALVGLVAGMLMFTIVFFSNIIPKDVGKKRIFLGVTALILISVITAGVVFFDKIMEISSIQNEIQAFSSNEDDVYINDISVDDDIIQFDTNHGKFNFVYLETGMIMMDEEMTPLNFEQNGTSIKFTDPPYDKMLRIQISTSNSLGITFKRNPYDARVEVVFDSEKFLGIRSTGNNVVKEVLENQMPEKFRGLESTFSLRGYLWFVTISRLDEVFFIGAGPDNYLYWFEQHDILGKVNMTHQAVAIADKPHNTYLQIASQTGVVSLMAWLSLLGIYFITTLRKIGVRQKKEFNEFLAGGIISGITGFLAASLFVDSSVGVGTVFYLLLGIGIYLTGVLPGKPKKIRLKPKS